MDGRNALNRTWQIQIGGRRLAGRPQKRWMENGREDIGLAGLKEENARKFSLDKITALSEMFTTGIDSPMNNVMSVMRSEERP